MTGSSEAFVEVEIHDALGEAERAALAELRSPKLRLQGGTLVLIAPLTRQEQARVLLCIRDARERQSVNDRMADVHRRHLRTLDSAALRDWLERLVVRGDPYPDLDVYDRDAIAEEVLRVHRSGDATFRARLSEAVEMFLWPMDFAHPSSDVEVTRTTILLAGYFRVRNVAPRLRALALHPKSSSILLRGEPAGSLATRTYAGLVHEENEEEVIALLREVRFPAAGPAVYSGLVNFRLEHRDSLFLESALLAARAGSRPALYAVCAEYLRRPPKDVARAASEQLGLLGRIVEQDEEAHSAEDGPAVLAFVTFGECLAESGLVAVVLDPGASGLENDPDASRAVLILRNLPGRKEVSVSVPLPASSPISRSPRIETRAPKDAMKRVMAMLVA